MGADPVCLGDTITFTLSGVVDDGGVLQEFCNSKVPIPPVTPTYTWIITKPDGTTVPPSTDPPGIGSIAIVTADIPGEYSCEFTASANRDCPPPDLTITEKFE